MFDARLSRVKPKAACGFLEATPKNTVVSLETEEGRKSRTMLINESEELALRERLLEKQKIESTNERKPIMLCIGVDVGQQSDPSVFVAVQKTRNHRFLKWQESQTARVDLNDPLSGLEAQYVDDVSFDVVMIRRVRL